jgi:putative membrane protein
MSLLILASHHVDDDWGPGHWWPVFPLLWIAVIFGVLFFARRCGFARRRGLGALEERYARGEIDANEYRERRDVLKGRDGKKGAS